MTTAIENAMWRGGTDQLHELAPCICCCAEHTFEECPARAWFGCRGNGVTPQDDAEAWAEHYQAHHGMTREEFFS